jgi:hypothetical protein
LCQQTFVKRKRHINVLILGQMLTHYQSQKESIFLICSFHELFNFRVFCHINIVHALRKRVEIFINEVCLTILFLSSDPIAFFSCERFRISFFRFCINLRRFEKDYMFLIAFVRRTRFDCETRAE